MADTCRHEWALGGDGCVNCGESWAALHPEEEVASPERRGLNRLLACFPKAEVVYVGGPQYIDRDPLVRAYPSGSPWLSVDLRPAPSVGIRRFAIWKTTGHVYELDERGAVGDDPVISLVTPP